VNRRSGQWIVRILLAVTFVVGLLAPQAAHATAPPVEPTAPTTTEIVVDEANPFLPENRDLSECIGTLQRPGCGSEARGGWRQNLVAIIMVSGLLIVFGRVAWGVRKSQKNLAITPPPD
jgi:hypothetical protein